MNIATDQLQNARTIVDHAQEILIVLSANHTLDKVASGLSLYLALSSKGKRVSITCAAPMTVEYSYLIGVDKISNNFSIGNGKNLVISFPYQEGSIEKVSYNIENETFNLVIEPREGYPIITPEMMRYTFSGGTCDLIITLGATRLTDLNSIYTNNEGFFADKPILNIDSQANNELFGKSNIIDPTSSSLSEVTTNLLSYLGFSLNADIATNLYSGISAGSQNFTSKETSANTFEAVAILLRNGARKAPGRSNTITTTTSTHPTVTPPAYKINRPTFPNQPRMQPIQQKSFSTPAKQSFQPSPPQPQAIKKNINQAETPPDWLKPKIYKGSTLL